MVNESLTNLDISYSNFVGPYEFLEKNNLKKFRFAQIIGFFNYESGEFTFVHEAKVIDWVEKNIKKF
jgi:hypothetical protein